MNKKLKLDLININYNRFGKPDIVRFIEASCIRWLEHLFRYNDLNPNKSVTFRKVEDTQRERLPSLPSEMILLKDILKIWESTNANLLLQIESQGED